MAHPTDSGLSSADPKNGHDHHPRPHLCSACSQIDFKALFTSHARPIDEKIDPIGVNLRRRNQEYYSKPICKCAEIFEAREKTGWPTPESADDSKPPCCFCAFYTECLLHSKDLALRSATVSRDLFRNGTFFKAFHSLTGFWIQHEGCDNLQFVSSCKHYVEDVMALQFVAKYLTPGLDFDRHRSARGENMGHAILRVVDDPKFSGLTRSRAAGGGLLARRILPDQVNYNLINEWLNLCRLGHIQCRGDADVVSLPGFQVIDCITGNIICATDAFGTGGERGQVEYITLSYVWGEAEFIGPILREHGLSLPNELPLVIGDAIKVVDKLGYRYLWIDRYCIPQNDLRAKQSQIKSMETIYSRSALTIIAAAGDGPEYGLPGVSSRHRTAQLSVEVAEGISLALYEKPKSLVTASKWITRGWTYQEGLLSQRRLIFTDQLTYFQCYEMHGDEVLSLPIPEVPDSSGEDDGQNDQLGIFRYVSLEHRLSDFGTIFPRRIDDWSDPNTAWTRIGEFAQRQLAYDADTLDAIAGIFGKYLTFNTTIKPKDKKVWFFYGLPIVPFQRVPPFYEGEQELSTGSLRTILIKYVGQPWSNDRPSMDGVLVESAVNNVWDSLTCRLIESLIWRDHWSVLMDTPLRRSMFPSWTWASWKTCTIRHERFEMHRVFDSCTTVHVEYEDESGLLQRLDWEEDNEEIQNLSRQESKIPLCLVIKGTVMDMKLAWREDDGRPGAGEEKEPGKWTFTWPPFLEGEVLWVPRCMFDKVEPESGSDSSSTGDNCNEEVGVLGLILAATCYFGEDPNLWVLILKPVTRISNGRPQTIYERAHLFRICCQRIRALVEYKQDWGPLSDFFMETTVRLC